MEYPPREPKKPREKYHFRWWRRNNSILNRDTKNWFGVEARYVGHPKIEEKILKKAARAAQQVRDQNREATRES